CERSPFPVSVTLFLLFSSLYFFNDPASTEIYTLSLHDALPISLALPDDVALIAGNGSDEILQIITTAVTKPGAAIVAPDPSFEPDRKSTRLNSSHVAISYAVFCLKKKKKIEVYQLYVAGGAGLG